MARAMQAKLPAKIDIGPVYNVDPQRRKAYSGHSAPSQRFALVHSRQCIALRTGTAVLPSILRHSLQIPWDHWEYCMEAHSSCDLIGEASFGVAGLGGERSFAPMERELVFDIDLTDYDDVRTCGKEGHICNACWPLMAVAVEVHTVLLRAVVCCA